jgi:hypothetical protein
LRFGRILAPAASVARTFRERWREFLNTKFPNTFAIFAYAMAPAPEVAFETCANKFLSAEMSNRLKQKFPPSSYQSTADWPNAAVGR